MITHRPKGAHVKTRSEPSVPSLTPETWELLEYRIWSRFRTKLWTAVGAFLTAVGLAGLLGIPAYIRGEILQQTNAEAAKIAATRRQLQRQVELTLARGELLLFVESQVAEASNELTRACGDVAIALKRNDLPPGVRARIVPHTDQLCSANPGFF